MRKRVSYIIIIIIIGAALLAGSIWTVQRNSDEINDHLFKTNTETLCETYYQFCRKIEANVVARWNHLESFGYVFGEADDDLTEKYISWITDSKEKFGYTDFYLMDDSGNYMTAGGEKGYIDLGQNLFLLSDGESIITDGSLPRRENMMFYAVPANPATYKGFKYSAIAFGYDINAMSDIFTIGAFNGKSSAYIIYPNGRVSVTAGNASLSIKNVLSYLESMGVDSAIVDTISADLKDSKTGTHELSLEGQNYYIHYTDLGISDWMMFTLTPSEEINMATNSVREAITSSFTKLSLSIGFVLLIAAALGLINIKSATTAKIQRESNEKLSALNKDLEKAKKAAEEAQHQAERANQAKTTFLNSMSHDIRTPMNAIIGFTNLAIEHADDKNVQQNYLSKIQQASEHLLSLINDVLDMARIESGKVTIKEKEENLAEILHGLQSIIIGEVKAKNQILSIDTVDIKNESIVCDKLRLNQILLNIVSNAIKYTPDGGKIWVRVAQLTAAENGRADFEFRIKDNGIGMSKEYISTVFEPFTREQTSTVSGIQGTGLGLAITKNIVDMMGGTITCSSEPGVGSEFVVTLSLRTNDGEEIKALDYAKDIHCLVVDDDIESCQIISELMRGFGIRTEWCVSGNEALVRTKDAERVGDKFSLYVIDWRMPGMGGMETARAIRSEIDNTSNIIMVTAYDHTDIEEDARAAGVTAILSKPLFPSDMQRALSSFYDKGAAVAPAVEEKKEYSFQGRILLAEDNLFNQQIAVVLLQKEGFVVEIAANGQIACNMLLEKGAGYYDLVLMDIQMPVMDGYEAARTIRAFSDKALSGIPIIAMTANAFAEDKEMALAAGMDEHITKPIDTAVLFAELQKIIGADAN